MSPNDQKNLDIAIIQPPGWAVQNPPLGLATLKSYLASKGQSAKNFDLNIILYNLRSGLYSNAWDLANGYYTWGNSSYINNLFAVYSQEIAGFIYSILSQRPKVIGLSVHWSSILAARALARQFRQYAPEVKIVFGGPQIAYYTSEWRGLLEQGEMDAVVFGEGEESLSEYLSALGTLNSKPIKGVAYRGRDQKIVDGGVRELIKDLDSLPFADFSDFNLDLYAGREVIPTYFSRGCVNRCCYCTENKFFPRFRNRSGHRLYAEVAYQLSRYPQTKYIRLHDSVSNGNIKELESFCDLLIKNKLNVGFNLENAIIRKEMADPLYKKLRQAGCTLIGYGLETPSKTLLKKVGKNACLDADFEKVVVEGARNNMTIGINMMFGLPGETDDDFQQQLLFIRKIKKYRRSVLINPALNFCYFPEGSEAYTDPQKFNVDLTQGELYWESKDGRNTFLTRLSHFEEFCRLADKLGYNNFFGVTENANKYALLGRYYYIKKDYPAALEHLLRSFQGEVKTAELAKEILALYAQTSREQDETYQAVKTYLEAEGYDPGTGLASIKNRQELNDFILRQTLASSRERINRFLAGRRTGPRAGFSWSLSGIKTYVKQTMLALFARLWQKINHQDLVLAQLLTSIDNKIEAVQAAKGER